MSIAIELIELAEQSARAHGATAVRGLDVEIGALAGVEVFAPDLIGTRGGRSW